MHFIFSVYHSYVFHKNTISVCGKRFYFVIQAQPVKCILPPFRKACLPFTKPFVSGWWVLVLDWSVPHHHRKEIMFSNSLLLKFQTIWRRSIVFFWCHGVGFSYLIKKIHFICHERDFNFIISRTYYTFFKLMISWSVSNLQFPLGFFLVKPANDTLSILKTS
jgi:hypothetical protein